MDRKYKQRGYQDGASGDDVPKAPVPKNDREGPRSPNMMAFQGAMRCGMCGEPVQLELTGVDVDSSCTKCKADLRTCRNCVNFDPGARWECRATIALRVGNKTARTECDQFTPRKTVEKKTTESRPTVDPKDPRAAFDRLFKR
jgi:hypothetical protein